MIRLVYSNRTEELMLAVAEAVLAERAAGSVLDPVTLIVPSGHVEARLKLGIARANGVAANLDACLLSRFVERLAGPAARVLDADAYLDALLALLLDDAFLREPELGPVRDYLYAAGTREEAVDTRRFQLALKVARFFEEYAWSRPEMLQGWRERGRTGVRRDETEEWQRALWVAARDLLDARSPARRERAVAVYELAEAPFAVVPRAHVFGFAHFARSAQKILARLAREGELHVYSFNPCMEFWEDVRGARPARRRKSLPRSPTLPLFASDADDPLALRLWGRPGRENVQFLDELAGFDAAARFADTAPTLLGRLQRDILQRRSPEPSSQKADASLALLACPSPKREAEAVAAEIWRVLRDEAELRISDIAILVASPDAEAYAALLGAALDECHEIPHEVLGRPLSSGSRVPEAVAHLLALPAGHFTRREVMRVATHPCILSGFPGASASEWVGHCEALGIVRGADRDDARGSYVERDLFNWDQGLRRLALGAVMTGLRSGDSRPFELAGERYLPEELESGRREGAMSFALLARSLLADARFARSARLPMRDWAAFLRLLAVSYVVPATDADERALTACASALQDLERVDLGGREAPYTVASQLAREALARLGAGSAYATDGVTVAPLHRARDLPFDVVFVVGLGEGSFPAPEAADPLDVRGPVRRPGDVSPRERDKYAFLEVLLSARRRLVLSYVARDALTGEPLAPSSVVSELGYVLERGYLGPGALSAITRNVPPRRHQDDPFGLPYEAGREARAFSLGRSLRGALGEAEPMPDLAELRASVAPELRPRLDERLGVVAVPPATEGGQERVTISIAALRRFLECPLQGHARYRLGLDEDEPDDLLSREDEPFETPYGREIMFLRDVFVRARGVDVEAAYAEAAALEELTNHGPTGVFAGPEREEHRAILAQWRAQFAEAMQGRAADLSVLRVGRAEEQARVDALVDPIVLTLPPRPEEGQPRPVRVEVVGRTEPLTTEPRGSWVLSFRSVPTDRVERLVRERKEALRAFLDHVVLAATGKPPASHAAFLAVAGKTSQLSRIDFAPVTRDEAVDYLGRLTSDLLAGSHAYLLPCEAVFRFDLRRGEAETPAESIAAVRDAYDARYGRKSYSSIRGPVPDAQRFPIPTDDEAFARIERRFGLFFAKARESRS
jgi:exodeoxyribonuclease V gamma subunit